MKIKEVSLTGFRNLKELHLELNQGINIFYGDNAQGKTNFLEALYFCGMGRSHRTKNDSQLIAFDAKESHIRLFLEKKKRQERIDVHLKKEEKKGIAVNGIPIKRLGDLYGTLYLVIFSPEDLNIIKEGPSERRKFMDMELCQLSHIYYYDLQQYYRILKQRNHLLKQLQKNPYGKDSLTVWDEQLLQYGKRIMSARKRFVITLNDISGNILEDLTGGKDVLQVEYLPNVDEVDFEMRLKKNSERDIYMGSTQVGPHKDDISFLVNGKEVKTYGSQGQQRTAALAAKLAEIVLIREETGYDPVLLLDDVLSELDEHRQAFLMERVKGLQAIFTCTGIEDAIMKYLPEATLFLVNQGGISNS